MCLKSGHFAKRNSSVALYPPAPFFLVVWNCDLRDPEGAGEMHSRLQTVISGLYHTRNHHSVTNRLSTSAALKWLYRRIYGFNRWQCNEVTPIELLISWLYSTRFISKVKKNTHTHSTLLFAQVQLTHTGHDLPTRWMHTSNKQLNCTTSTLCIVYQVIQLKMKKKTTKKHWLFPVFSLSSLASCRSNWPSPPSHDEIIFIKHSTANTLVGHLCETQFTSV